MTQLIYPGTFDPFTKGHHHIVERVSHYFDTIIIAVAADTLKQTLFSATERSALIKAILPKATVVIFSGLLTQFIKQYDKPLLLRGVRTVQDFEYEAQIAMVNQQLAMTVETLLLTADGNHRMTSASMVKEIAQLGGDVTPFVDDKVAKALQQKYAGNY